MNQNNISSIIHVHVCFEQKVTFFILCILLTQAVMKSLPKSEHNAKVILVVTLIQEAYAHSFKEKLIKQAKLPMHLFPRKFCCIQIPSYFS